MQSVDRAVAILEILSEQGEAGVSDVATAMDVHKSTAFRLLCALEARGLVEQDGERGKYHLGFGIVRLAGAVTGRIAVTRYGRKICDRLAQELGETINIAVLEAECVINLDQVSGPSAIAAQNWVGRQTPLHSTANGKVLLADLAPEVRHELLAEAGLPRTTPHTLTSEEELEAALAKVRACGYALALEEYEEGLNAIAAPIRSAEGETVAALTASGPAYRFTEEHLHEIAPALVAGAEEISRRLSKGN
ncbi:IclR family transcriptional regulator [Streptomyces sp. B-S-A6]|uniref:IclR family transcriptional regulator n=1 Tax=Streptomyces cavernicola TaxID=3043613 RepID=A0ABT6SMR8_9ACTN|nr:IclR family transcriptional regulator [Streptomyces sp. B-S-A6]MDI3409467.1 IclR family transcriptional regulator [Streptomyces sp. B-S-A6]